MWVTTSTPQSHRSGSGSHHRGEVPEPIWVPGSTGSENRAPTAAPLERADPRRVGGYEILARLGMGGMGTVYLGRDDEGDAVAVKLIHPHLAANAEFRARFAREALAGRRVPAFCSARVLGNGDHSGRPYLVTEYIDGVPLSQLVAENGYLPLTDLHSLALGTAASLAAIHSVGLVHRDVKPSNIIMALGGVRIIDFGIARALDDTGEFTRTGVVMGSLGWAAPEQLTGEPPSPAMDVFGWGSVIGYAATGRHPFGGADLNARAWQVLHGEPDLRGIPHPLRAVVSAALHCAPEARPTTRELLLALVGAVSPEATGPGPSGANPARSAPGRRFSPTQGPDVEAPRTATRAPRGAHRTSRRTSGVLAAAAPLVLAVVLGAAGLTELGAGSADPGHLTTTEQPPLKHTKRSGAESGRSSGGPGADGSVNPLGTPDAGTGGSAPSPTATATVTSTATVAPPSPPPPPASPSASDPSPSGSSSTSAPPTTNGVTVPPAPPPLPIP